MSLAGEGSHFETVSPSDLNGNRDDLDILNCMHGHSRPPTVDHFFLFIMALNSLKLILPVPSWSNFLKAASHCSGVRLGQIFLNSVL